VFRLRARKVRPTFLLQLVICVVTIAMVVAAVLIAVAVGLGKIIGMVLLALVVMGGLAGAGGFDIGLPFQVFADLLERFVLWRAARTGKPLNPRWFIDQRPNP